MNTRLAVLALGTRNSGKSTTWRRIFGGDVRTGKYPRPLYLTKSHYIDDVFLINGSPEERGLGADEILGEQKPTFVLCSTQYKETNKTIKYFIRNRYDIFVQWLNPGYNDAGEYEDNEKIIKSLLSAGAMITKRDGTINPDARVDEIRRFVFGWASAHNLINLDFSMK